MVNGDPTRVVLSLAERFPNPDEFISVIESLSIPEDKKGGFYLMLGIDLYNLSKFKIALSVWELSLKWFIKNKDVQGESSCYGNLGNTYRDLGDFKKAIEYHKKSFEIAKEIGDRSGEAKCYTGLGNDYYTLGNFRRAIEYHEKSLKIAKEMGNRSGEAKCYGNLGVVYDSLGNFRRAIEYHEKSLKIDKEMGNRSGEAECYTGLGLANCNLGNFRSAIEYHEKSLEITKEIGDISGESRCLNNLGIAYYSLGELRKAIEHYEKSLEIAKGIGDRSGEAKCYGNLGVAYHNLGKFRRAIEYHEKSLEIAKGIGNISVESSCYGNLGNTYHDLGDFKKAIGYHEKSLEIAKRIGDRSGQSKCFIALGNAYNSLDEFRKAIEHYEKTLEIAKGIGDRSVESKCYTNLGAAYDNLGDFRKAIEHYEKTLEIAKGMGDRSVESNCYANLGAAYDSLGDFRKAIEYYEKSLEIDKGIGDMLGELITYSNLGISYLKSDELTRSLNLLKRSIDIRESIKGELSLEELRISFHAQAVSTYDAQSFVYLRLGEVAQSINTLEWSKTRELADALFYAEALKDNPKFREIIQEKSRLKHKVELINEWKDAVSEAEKILGDASINGIKTDIERTEKEYATVSSTLNHLYDEVAGLRPKDFDITSHALDVLRKENGWVVLEYLLLPSKSESELVVFVINEKGEINPIRSRYDKIKLGSLIQKYIEAVITSSKEEFREKAESELRELSADLYTMLFPKDVEDAIEGLKAKHFIIVPHKGLHLVPWEILFNGEDYLGLKYAISKNFSLDLTSIAMNKRMNIKNDGIAALLMGNPTLDLAGAETEVYKIENRLNSIVEAKTITLQRDKATKQNFIDNIKNPLNIFHFSGHGQFQTPPGFSSLVLNNKNALTANELSGLSFEGSPIVSLSACDSGITAPISGDELMGLIRGFIIAGSSSIVSTSWRVYDNSACRLMVEFYENLINKNCVGLSLKRARETIFNDYNGEILHWGAYTLYGDPFRAIP
jgi:tetratricopeptide (TPR) repeat protein